VNACWQGDAIRRYNVVHVGVAVAVEDGLITPVIRNADRKGMVQISGELKELAGRPGEKKLKPEQYTRATFSVSSLGAVDRVEQTPVIEDGDLVAQPRMRVTMSCDHRGDRRRDRRPLPADAPGDAVGTRGDRAARGGQASVAATAVP